jgi:hypothetical protein
MYSLFWLNFYFMSAVLSTNFSRGELCASKKLIYYYAIMKMAIIKRNQLASYI